MSESITLRSHLTGALNDLVESANLGTLGKCSVICELVTLFVDYQEEGASLFLDAFLTDNLENITAMIPDSGRLKLGVVKCDEAGIRKAVKKAAPLVRGCWKMYLAPRSINLEFGLFRDSAHPLNVPIDLVLQTGGAGTAKFIRVTRLAQDSVRVSTNGGKQIIVHFTNERDGVADAGESLATLCKLACSGIEAKPAQTIETYLASLLSSALRASHGALVAIVPSSKIPRFLDDCTPLEPPICLSAAVEAVRNNSNALPQLQALESLVCGMFCCDGIVVIDTKANVVAYNGFIRLEASNVVGGARKRAYQALCAKIGKGLVAAYYQSQDGASDLQKS